MNNLLLSASVGIDTVVTAYRCLEYTYEEINRHNFWSSCKILRNYSYVYLWKECNLCTVMIKDGNWIADCLEHSVTQIQVFCS
jgi:hypothetical protein